MLTISLGTMYSCYLANLTFLIIFGNVSSLSHKIHCNFHILMKFFNKMHQIPLIKAVFSGGGTFDPKNGLLSRSSVSVNHLHNVDAAGCVQCDVLAIELSTMNGATTCCCCCLDTPKRTTCLDGHRQPTLQRGNVGGGDILTIWLYIPQARSQNFEEESEF